MDPHLGSSILLIRTMTNENPIMPESYHPPYNIRYADGEWVATFIVTNEEGLHARPAALLRKFVSSYSPQIHLSRNDERHDAKSIIGIMMLGAEYGSHVSLHIPGSNHPSDPSLAIAKETLDFITTKLFSQHQP